MAVPKATVRTNGAKKYGSAGLLLSSADRGWRGLAADLRSHSNGIVARKSTQPDTEISVDICGNGSVVRRQGGGIFERSKALIGVCRSTHGDRKQLAEFCR